MAIKEEVGFREKAGRVILAFILAIFSIFLGLAETVLFPLPFFYGIKTDKFPKWWRVARHLWGLAVDVLDW